MRIRKNKDFQATSLFSSICIMQQLGCKSKQNQYVRSILCRPTPTSITQQQHGQLPPRAIGNGRCNGIHIWWAVVISVALLPARWKYICTAVVSPTKHLHSFICCKSMQCPNTNKCLEQQWCQSSFRSNGMHSFPRGTTYCLCVVHITSAPGRIFSCGGQYIAFTQSWNGLGWE